MEQTPSNAPIMEPKSGMAGWFSVWMKAVTKPTEQTFIEITESPDATIKTAFTWAALTGLLNGLLIGIVLIASSAMQGGFSSDSMTGMLAFICIAPIVGIFGVPLGLAVAAGLNQWVAKLFGGTGTFEKLAYGYSAVMVPLLLVNSVITLFSLIPFIGLCISLFSYLIWGYQVFLQVVATKAVNRFGWGQAIGSVLIPTFVFVFIFACLAIVGLIVMGPAIGEVFNQINQSLAP
jgi:hypothetical protein